MLSPWCSLGRNVFVLIPLVILQGSSLKGVRVPGPMVESVDRGSVFSGHPRERYITVPLQ